jgi:rhomboid family GlyGly-CTERM serine protease
MEAPLKDSPHPKPWLALGFGLLILGLGFSSASFAEALLFNRPEILQGQLWRLWTAHVLHFGWSHLCWNLLVFIIAAGWIERLSRRALLGLILLSPPIISGGLLISCPSLAIYAGLSGMDTALIAFLGISSLRQKANRTGLVLLGILLMKIGAEFVSDSSLFAGFNDPGIQSVPLSHLVGMLAGILVGIMPMRVLKIVPLKIQESRS